MPPAPPPTDTRLALRARTASPQGLTTFSRNATALDWRHITKRNLGVRKKPTTESSIELSIHITISWHVNIPYLKAGVI